MHRAFVVKPLLILPPLRNSAEFFFLSLFCFLFCMKSLFSLSECRVLLWRKSWNNFIGKYPWARYSNYFILFIVTHKWARKANMPVSLLLWTSLTHHIQNPSWRRDFACNLITTLLRIVQRVTNNTLALGCSHLYHLFQLNINLHLPEIFSTLFKSIIQ